MEMKTFLFTETVYVAPGDGCSHQPSPVSILDYAATGTDLAVFCSTLWAKGNSEKRVKTSC